MGTCMADGEKGEYGLNGTGRAQQMPRGPLDAVMQATPAGDTMRDLG